MQYIFSRDVVLPSNRGFVAGQTMPLDVLTSAQIESFLVQGFLVQVFTKQDVLEAEVFVKDDEEEPEPLSEIEALDPERKARKKR